MTQYVFPKMHRQWLDYSRKLKGKEKVQKLKSTTGNQKVKVKPRVKQVKISEAEQKKYFPNLFASKKVVVNFSGDDSDSDSDQNDSPCDNEIQNVHPNFRVNVGWTLRNRWNSIWIVWKFFPTDKGLRSGMPISTFETSTRIYIIDSRVSRRERELPIFSLILRDESKNFPTQSYISRRDQEDFLVIFSSYSRYVHCAGSPQKMTQM